MKKALILFIVFLATIACDKPQQGSVKNITQEEFAKLKTTEIQLLDVRTPDEVNKGIIKGAKIVNFYDDDFTVKAAAKFDKSKPLYIYCAAGGRSSKASSQLVLEGFDEVYNLLGGYRQWIKKQKK